MRKYFLLLILTLSLLSVKNAEAVDRRLIIDSLTNIDPEIRKYFPRWKVCETDLQIQIYQGFRLLGFDETLLDKGRIEVLAAPHNDPSLPFDILLITCGEASMKANEVDANFGGNLIGILSGDLPFNVMNPPMELKRDYCFSDIPPEIPITASQAIAITSFLEPTNVTHAFTISLFEQGIKVGNSGFWLKNMIGNDDIGYPFWSAGESKIILKRPLYVNHDSKTSDRIPFLINAYLGGGYRISSGLNNNNNVLSWVTGRKLNNGPGGRIVAGMDFNMPFHPQFGLNLNLEMPMRELRREYAKYEDYYNYDIISLDDAGIPKKMAEVSPILRASGVFALFYNWWLDNSNPENFIRTDFGINYAEVREVPREFVYDTANSKISSFRSNFIDPNIKPENHPDFLTNPFNFKTFKPNEVGDWIYAKVEYRNQATWPFGVSLQYSNQILLSRIYIPLLGDWFYIEAKYATPLRGLRPYEVKNFFMISPVLRLTI